MGKRVGGEGKGLRGETNQPSGIAALDGTSGTLGPGTTLLTHTQCCATLAHFEVEVT